MLPFQQPHLGSPNMFNHTTTRTPRPYPPTAAQFSAIGQEIARFQFSTSERINRERFVSFFGIEPYLCQIVWTMIYDDLDLYEHEKEPKHLLWALLFLKGYDLESKNAALCGVDEKTYRKWTWLYVGILADFDVDVIKFHDRFVGQTGNKALMTVDGTDFAVHELANLSKKERQKWYSHKFGRAGIKYEIGVCIHTGDIVHYYGPFRGAIHDLTIFQSHLAKFLAPGEMVVADRGYRGDSRIYTPYNPINAQHNRAMSAARARHETINGRLCNFGCLSQVWRHALNKHVCVFRACLVLVQLMHKNGREAFGIEDYTDNEANFPPPVNIHEAGGPTAS